MSSSLMMDMSLNTDNALKSEQLTQSNITSSICDSMLTKDQYDDCLGDDEVIYFEYDYFIEGGYSRKKRYCQFGNMAMDYTCQGFLLFLTLICSNFLEIPLTSAVLFEMKKSTESVTNMLRRKALAERKR